MCYCIFIVTIRAYIIVFFSFLYYLAIHYMVMLCGLFHIEMFLWMCLLCMHVKGILKIVSQKRLSLFLKVSVYIFPGWDGSGCMLDVVDQMLIEVTWSIDNFDWLMWMQFWLSDKGEVYTSISYWMYEYMYAIYNCLLHLFGTNLETSLNELAYLTN